MKQNAKARRVSRRMFLRGAGGAALGIPFLTSLLPRHAIGQPDVVPIRYVQWMTNHGQVDEYFWPNVNRDDMPEVASGVRGMALGSIAGQLSDVVDSAFDPLRAKMNMIRGLDCMHSATDHSSSAPTCASQARYACDGDHSCFDFQHSIDAVIEDFPGLYTAPVRTRALRLTPGLSYQHKWGSFSWRDGEKLFSHDTLRGAMEAVFSDETEGPDPQLLAQRDILDRVLSDYRHVRGSARITASDRARLDDYMDLIAGVQSRLDVEGPSCAMPTIVEGGNNDTLHQNATDIASAALICGATRVVAYHCMHVNSGEDANAGMERAHDWAHNGGPDHRAMSHWRLQFLARLASNLDAFTDPDGRTALDNSIVYASNEMGKGDHRYTNMPTMTFGSAGGRLRTGELIDYGAAPLNNFLITLFDLMGLSPADYERDGVVGFGDYDGRNIERYATYFASDASKRAPLSYLLT